MKRLKKLMALLLAAIMTLAMATTAFAAGSSTGTLTVKVAQNNTLQNQTVSIYRLFDLTVSGDTQDKKYAYTVNSQYKDILKELLSLKEDAADKDYYDAVAKIGNDNSKEVQDFADQFTKKLLTAQPSIEADKSTKVTGEETSVTFTDVPYGYYLVYQTGTKELQSSLVSVDAATKEITLKGEAPSIEKTADHTSVEIGQVVKYTITGTIPDTTGYANYQYIIHDTLSSGLDFVKNQKGEAITDKNLPVTITIQDGQDETKNAAIDTNNDRKMSLDLSQWIQDNQAAYTGKTFTVVYYAKVNEKAVVAEKNSASLEYGNKPGETTTTTPVEKPTPTYPLDINKTNTEKEKLAGATFRLYKEKTDADAANNNAIKVTGQDGKYVVDPTSQNKDMVTVKTDLDSKGYNLHLNGLAAGTYYLVETKAPDGYNKLAAPVKITITEGGETNVDGWTISKDDTPENDKVIDIENLTGSLLPETGGRGAMIFTVIAVILVLGVAISFIRDRRAEN